MDNKNERFRTVASRRTNAVIEQLRLLANCGNTHNYSYSDDEVARIFKAIDSQLRETKKSFTKSKKNNSFHF